MASRSSWVTFSVLYQMLPISPTLRESAMTYLPSRSDQRVSVKYQPSERSRTVGWMSQSDAGVREPAARSRSKEPPLTVTISTVKTPRERSARIRLALSLPLPLLEMSLTPNCRSKAANAGRPVRESEPPRARTTSPSAWAAAISPSHSAGKGSGVGVGSGVTPGGNAVGVAVGGPVAGVGADVGVGSSPPQLASRPTSATPARRPVMPLIPRIPSPSVDRRPPAEQRRGYRLAAA